jgi:heterodisulfide reductase subunit D
MEEAMIISPEQIDYCMECGVCTGSCPISRMMTSFSPRQMIKRALMDRDETVVQGRELWACLTCARCSTRCPAQIDFPEFARVHRELARKEGNLPQLSHHGTLQAIATLHTRNVKQQRTDWAKEAGTFKKQGEIFYFVGCAPYFEAVLKPGEGSLEVPRSVLGLLNRMGIEPVISNDERCCGHDALWGGDEATFKKLVEKNLEVIRASGAKTVLFSCPEGYTTFSKHVPQYFSDLPFEVLHITEFLARELPGSGVKFTSASNNGKGGVTYQDPCRLGRVAGIYEPPRELIRLIPEISFEEMPRNRENAVCCGTSAWMECSNCSKTIQIERLQEAREIGARTVITSCPKCRIHLSCGQQNTDLVDLEVVDLFAFLLKHVE